MNIKAIITVGSMTVASCAIAAVLFVQNNPMAFVDVKESAKESINKIELSEMVIEADTTAVLDVEDLPLVKVEKPQRGNAMVQKPRKNAAPCRHGEYRVLTFDTEGEEVVGFRGVSLICPKK